MQSNTDSDNLIFLHIPKNAGTTFFLTLERIFSKDETFDIQVVGNGDRMNTDDFLNLSESERSKIKLLRGHLLYGMHKHLPGKSEYITFLRKPEHRVVSYYNYVMGLPEHRLYEKVAGENMSLYDFVCNIDDEDVHNAQIHMISGVVDSEEVMLEKAIENINKDFSFVGLVERFDESMMLFNQLCNMDVRYYTSLNKSRKKVYTLDEKTRNAIQERNQGDKAFYKIMEDKFNEELNKIGFLNYKLFRFAIRNLIMNYHFRRNKFE